MKVLAVGFTTFFVTAIVALSIMGLGFVLDAGIASVLIFGLFNSFTLIGISSAISIYSSIAYGIVVMSVARAISFARWAVK